ncbi:dihydroorotase [Nonlabens sp. SY33080]|uniref:dihydroorotase n=1 Tax=Nonlabens sp. SY33080 TaxID=2719911 RepID=UPI001428B5B7|nr:dihydroorotase [Nonlabens sp. SY33080]
MILIKQAKILDEYSDHHDTIQDILIEDGIIKKIASNISEDQQIEHIINVEGLHISIGWIDSSVCSGEPGFEERQTLNNLVNAASIGGFTTVLLNPNNQPNPEEGSQIKSLKNYLSDQPVDLIPIGSLTLSQKGEHLAELYDMKEAGAAGFYDFKKSITNANLMKVALQYSTGFNAVIQSYPENSDLAGKGMVNEDSTTALLGLKSKPAMAETVQVARDLQILSYTGGLLHFPTVSLSESVNLIDEARSQGLSASCSVSINNLLLDSQSLLGFEANFKLDPPLRNEEEKTALLQDVKSGKVQMVTSDHIPLDIEHKKLEFDRAKSGSTAIEVTFKALNAVVDTYTSVKLLTGAYDVFPIERPRIQANHKAVITMFTDSENDTITSTDLVSTSKNCALLGCKTRGRVLGIINGKKIKIYE